MAKHYAISDIHGMYDIYEQVCAMLQPDDVVYFLGDAGDRGYKCFETIKAIYENPQWIYLKGNHEDLMAKGLKEIFDDDFLTGKHKDFDLWMYNGGKRTYDGWFDDCGDPSWIEKLNNLELKAEYTNSRGITFHMSHAGYTCGRPDEMIEYSLVWNRRHFFEHWDDIKYEHDICIHGHTPMEYFVEKCQLSNPNVKSYDCKYPEARVYCHGHKINIDNGVFYTGATVLYDLDEMKAISLFDKTFNEGSCDD